MTVQQFLNTIQQYTMEEYFSKFGEIERILNGIEKNIADRMPEEKEKILEGMAEQTQNAGAWMRIHILSFCMKTGMNAKWTQELLACILKSDFNEVGEYNKLSHFWQVSTAIFMNYKLRSPEANRQLAELYTNLFRRFTECFGLKGRRYIPWKERTRGLVFVFISQVLGMEHAPTKTLLDRCYVLQKYLHKKVYIINTAMQIPPKGQAPFYGLVNAEYAEVLSEQNELEFRGEHFDFFQCENKMPDLELMAEIIRMVKQKKPEILLTVGGSDICADLCGLFITQITIGTVFSRVAVSCGEYQIVDKELTEEDEEILSAMGVEPEKVKRAIFTFSFKEQTHTFTRAALGFGEGRFILAIVGWRLDIEIDTAFLDMLAHVVEENADLELAFIGIFDTFEEKTEAYPLLRRKSHCLGKQMDVLAVFECCDLYVNPKRSGGGSSVAEALYKGLPAVTLQTGDVAAAAGELFCVSDYAAMEEQILRYAADSDYYDKMKQVAADRAKLLTDSKKNFAMLISEIEKELAE